jgi:hypothetical protein
VQSAIRRDVDFFVFARREYRVEMRGQSNVGPGSIFRRVRDHVAPAIDARYTSQRAKLSQHILGAALLEECGCRDPAHLQVLLVDPLLLPDEPLQRIAERRAIGQIARHFRKWWIRREGDGFDRSCQMPV